MADQRNGGIVWTNQTWNPIRGCTRVSAGCMNCYAESMAARFCGFGQPYEGTINPETKRWNGTVRLVPEKLTDPLRWQRSRMVFVNSMSDLFHDDVPNEFIDQVFAVMALASQHTFQVLTKRPERMLRYLRQTDIIGRVYGRTKWLNDHHGKLAWPLPNVWLGCTIENQQAADERIPLLLQTPAAVRWVSMEPLLGATNIAIWLDQLPAVVDQRPCLDWVVVGGESGTNARPMHPDWARSLRDQCSAAGVPFLFKQWGEYRPSAHPEDFYPIGHKKSLMPKFVNRNISDDGDIYHMVKVGTKSAGRLLDGVKHDGYPEVQP